MHPLTELIQNDMKPALGVTEPGAIAFAVSTARTYAHGKLQSVELRMNSGMYKNAYTCGIPHSTHFGNLYAAALGVVAGNPELGLESLRDVTEEDNQEAEELVNSGKITVTMSEVSSRIHIEVTLQTDQNQVQVTIWDTHTNITSIRVDGKEVFSKSGRNSASLNDMELEQKSEAVNDSKDWKIPTGDAPDSTESENVPLIHRYTFKEILEYVNSVPAEDLEFIKDAFRLNCQLYEEGSNSPRTIYLHYLLEKNGGKMISEDEVTTASLLCNGAIEARVLGLDQPAMSITGSGAHGIIATMPLYGVSCIRGYSKEQLYRATALSYLICMYIKEYSGRLSAFCGCAIAAGSGMACGLVYLSGGGAEEMEGCLRNMASSITGMICDGGNHGCVMKGVAACDCAFRCADMAMNGIVMDGIHGINGGTPEETMRNMGRIASPGMVETESTIVEIMDEKCVRF